MAISSGSAPGMPADQELPSYHVLAALVVSLRGELARAQERIAELEDQGRPVTAVERCQVFDLPPAKATVTEHQLIERECSCGHRTRARPRRARPPRARPVALGRTPGSAAGFCPG